MSIRPVPLIVSAILLFLAWIMLTTSLHYQELIAGAIVAVALAFALNSIIPDGGKKGSLPKRIIGMFIFIFILAKEMILANLDVAYRVLHPKMPIKPGIVKVRPELESEMGKVILSNAITLTPGTLSMDWIEDDLYIHWINVDKKDMNASMEPLDGAVKEVFP